MKMEEIFRECIDLVEEVSAKFGYDNQDTKGNDSLKTVLLKCIPAMLKDAKKEDRAVFYQMLRHTPIVITENLTQESHDELCERYLGKDEIVVEEKDLGEYSKKLGAGAFVSRPIIDKDMKLQGKKSFVYIQKVTGKAKDFFGTDINVSHLIHELGHAWHAEKEQFVMQDDGTLKERVGTAEFIYSLSRTPDNKFAKKCIKTTGLMIEEGMNTVAEETAMANYMGISLEEMHKQYGTSLISSTYQYYIRSFVDYMIEKLGKDDFENYRLYGKIESKNKINALMEKTNYWINRETEILPSSNSQRSYSKKRDVLARIDSTEVQEFFKEYEDVFFPDVSKMTPLEKIDNVLMQYFNMQTPKYNIGIDNYVLLLERLDYEGYALINQTAKLLKLKEQQEVQSELGVRKEIAPSVAVKNALAQGTTPSQVYAASRIEQLEQNTIHSKEGRNER